MKKLEKLTKEQEVKIPEVRNYWLDYIFSCKSQINKEAAKIGISWLYKFSKLNEPIIIYVDSPMGCQYAVHYLKAYIKALSKIGIDIPDQVRDQVGAQVGDQVGAQVWDQVGAQVRDQVWAQVRDQVWAQVRAQVGAQVRAQVGDQVGAQVRDQELEYNSFSSYGNIGDFGWVSFADFFTQIGVLNNSDFNQFKNILLSGIYDMIQLNGFCIVSSLPSNISRNPSDRLHNLNGPAIEFRDGYYQHYINGRYIPAQIFDAIKTKSFTAEQFFKEKNEEVKSACIAMMQELYGEEYVFNFFRENLKEVDTYVDKKDEKYLEGTTRGMNVGVYTLFKGEINNEDVAYVRAYCPSTDRMFFLGVDPEYNNAKDAIASLYRVPKKLKNHIKYIQRQGERFSTVFDEKGTEVLKQNLLSKEDISDTTTISGDRYFELMKYEY